MIANINLAHLRDGIKSVTGKSVLFEPCRFCASVGKQQLPLKFNNLFLIGYNHRVHREHREVVRKMRDLVRFLKKYTLIFLSALSVFSGAPRGAHYLVDESSTKTRATQLILYRVLKPGGNDMV